MFCSSATNYKIEKVSYAVVVNYIVSRLTEKTPKSDNEAITNNLLIYLEIQDLRKR
jgi:hypothetical protein